MGVLKYLVTQLPFVTAMVAAGVLIGGSWVSGQHKAKDSPTLPAVVESVVVPVAPIVSPKSSVCFCESCKCGQTPIAPDVPKQPTPQITPTTPKVSAAPAKASAPRFTPGHPIAGGVYRVVDGVYVPVAASPANATSSCPGGVCPTPQATRWRR